jgi:hypothetical protein
MQKDTALHACQQQRSHHVSNWCMLQCVSHHSLLLHVTHLLTTMAIQDQCRHCPWDAAHRSSTAHSQKSTGRACCRKRGDVLGVLGDIQCLGTQLAICVVLLVGAEYEFTAALRQAGVQHAQEEAYTTTQLRIISLRKHLLLPLLPQTQLVTC